MYTIYIYIYTKIDIVCFLINYMTLHLSEPSDTYLYMYTYIYNYIYIIYMHIYIYKEI